MESLTHTLIATGLCAVFFYSGYAYAYFKLRKAVIDQLEALAEQGQIRIVMKDDDNEDIERDD